MAAKKSFWQGVVEEVVNLHLLRTDRETRMQEAKDAFFFDLDMVDHM